MHIFNFTAYMNFEYEKEWMKVFGNFKLNHLFIIVSFENVYRQIDLIRWKWKNSILIIQMQI